MRQIIVAGLLLVAATTAATACAELPARLQRVYDGDVARADQLSLLYVTTLDSVLYLWGDAQYVLTEELTAEQRTAVQAVADRLDEILNRVIALDTSLAAVTSQLGVLGDAATFPEFANLHGPFSTACSLLKGALLAVVWDEDNAELDLWAAYYGW